jgi:hypothetical protein
MESRMIPCSACGCCWDESGYYTYKGDIEQPCKECRLDTSSVYYLNNAEQVRERKRQAYYQDVERKREYYRNYRRQQRAATSA